MPYHLEGMALCHEPNIRIRLAATFHTYVKAERTHGGGHEALLLSMAEDRGPLASLLATSTSEEWPMAHACDVTTWGHALVVSIPRPTDGPSRPRPWSYRPLGEGVPNTYRRRPRRCPLG